MYLGWLRSGFALSASRLAVWVDLAIEVDIGEDAVDAVYLMLGRRVSS